MVFQKLFEPLNIGPVTIKNRIQVLPHNTLYTMERLADYCAARARGGAGLIEFSLATPLRELGELPKGPVDAWPYKGYDPEIIGHYRNLSKKVHDHGAKVFVQLAAAGGNRGARRGVSPIPGGIQRVTARELSGQEIQEIIRDHGIAARFAMEGGIDGIDLHGTHGMLIEEFTSKATNRRSDGYGGTLENRARIVRESVLRMREETGGQIAVGMRIDADDKFPGGNRLEDQVELSKSLDGLVDFINVDIGFEHQFMHLAIAPMYQSPGYQLYASKTIKSALGKTIVGAAGRIIDPLMAEQALRDGAADMIGMARALIADPDLPNKAREGRLDEIRHCLGDNQKCIGNMLKGLPIQCTVNPIVGREGEPLVEDIPPAARKKNVLVIGGGVAGLEVTRLCSVRGHKVTLIEKGATLGGLLNLAKLLPNREELFSIVRWYQFQLEKLSVEVKFNHEVTRDEGELARLLSDQKPDAVVLATGSEPIRDGMQSFNYRPIKGHEYAVTVDDVLSGAVKVGRNVLILDEVGFVEGLSLSEALSKAGSRVELMTRDHAPGLESYWSLQLPYLYESALRSGVRFTPNSFIEEIRASSAIVYNIYTSEREVREDVNSVILNTGRLPRDELHEWFKERVDEVYTVGESNLSGRQIGDVIAEAFDLGRTL